MDITATVKCSDQTIQLSPTILLQVDYFRDDLKITHETKTITNKDGSEQVIDYYGIPQLQVECKSTTLLNLLTSTRYCSYNVWPSQYDDDLIELFMYNDLYGFGRLIVFATYGFVVKEYFDLLLFIKQRMPKVNVYSFIRSFCFWSSYLEHSWKVCPKGELDKTIIPNLLEYLDYGLLQHYRSPYDNNVSINTLLTIAYCAENGFLEEIKRAVNTNKIKQTIEKFIERNKFHCKSTFYCNNRFEGMSNFITGIKSIYQTLSKLDELGVINLKEIDPVETYIKYMESLPLMN